MSSIYEILNKKETVLIGSSPESDIVLKDPQISPKHCKISRVDNDAYLIVDLNSANGTYVNNNRVSTGFFYEGDSIRVGSNSFHVRDTINEPPIYEPQQPMYDRQRSSVDRVAKKAPAISTLSAPLDSEPDIIVQPQEQPAFKPQANMPANSVDQKLEIEESILVKAKMNNQEALQTIFQQFIGVDENIKFCEYMGQLGLFILVTHSFVCITDKRIISLKIGAFGEITYQDAFFEYLNSGLIYQPSLLGLYIWSVLIVVIFPLSLAVMGAIALAFLFFIIALLLIPFFVKFYYKIHKCGLVFIIREGLSVYVFVNRNRMCRANALWRIAAQYREERIQKAPLVV